MKSGTKKPIDYCEEQSDSKLTKAWLDLREGRRTLTPELQQQLEAMGIPTAEIIAAAEAPPPPKERKGGWKNSGIPYKFTATGRREAAYENDEADRALAQIMQGRYDEWFFLDGENDEALSPAQREEIKAANLETRKRQKTEYDMARREAFDTMLSCSPEKREELKARDPAVYDLFVAILRQEVGEDWEKQFDDPSSAAAIREWINYPD